MATFTKINTADNSVVIFPYTNAEFKDENPNTAIKNSDLAAIYQNTADQITNPTYDVVELVEEDKPNVNLNHYTLSSNAVLEDNVWKLKWTSTKKDGADEIILNDEIDRCRTIRNNFLSLSDWTQLADSPLTESKKLEWTTHRQELRDITSHAEWPFDIQNDNWPVEPE
jgi:hypothetical protein